MVIRLAKLKMSGRVLEYQSLNNNFVTYVTYFRITFYL